MAEGSGRLPTLEAALGEAERHARDAEVALAQALGRQASEAAETRVAQAALAAARARVERNLRDRGRLEEEARALDDPAPIVAARRQATAARDAAIAAGEAARATRARADVEENAAIAEQARTQTVHAAARADLAALDGDIAALEKATRTPGPDRMLDLVRADAGYERALAAALGDDLEAGSATSSDRFWRGAEIEAGDPAPPFGTSPLARHVSAPPALARRLAQIMVADSDDGQPLAVGQRLVTRAGALRRWDGLVARTGGAAAAERLVRINRLADLTAARPAAAEAAEARAAEVKRAGQTIAAARAAAAAARAALDDADLARRDAARAEDRAVAAIERIEARAADLDLRMKRLAGEQADAQAEWQRAEQAQRTLPDTGETSAIVATLQRGAEQARAVVAQARADRSTLDRDLTTARERLAAAETERRGWRTRAGDAARRSADMDKREEGLAREAALIAHRPAELAGEIETSRTAHAAARGDADVALAQESAAGDRLRATEETARLAAEALAQAREIRAGAVARAENQEQRRIEMGRVSGERFECPPPVLPQKAGFDSAGVAMPQDESAAHEKLTLERERIGPVNLVAEAELAELDATRITNAAEREELGQAVNRLRGSIGNLNREGRQRLLAAFEAVNGHFQRLFAHLFGGGQAHLELIDSDDPLEAGLEILAQPPGKRLQSLTLLSGGEQALTAVALIFGLFLTNPAPICVLDEVDAPLDDANIERFCGLLDRMTQETRTRYLIVTHNAVTMSRMHRLFGVTMIERGVSRLVSVDLGGAETLLAAE